MLYLILFYWIFAGLFYFGVVFEVAKEEENFILGVFIGCLLIGGIFLPIYLGKSLDS